MAVLAVPVFLLLGVLQIYLGFVGIDYLFGVWWAWGAIGVAIFFRIMLPLTIGTYFAVVNVFHYPWYVGLIVAAPGLLFLVPAFIAEIVAFISKRR
ncbi:hypothetical protein [Rhabdaerophilum sp.]|uniref:hypothetical protein n=1 Tax=Rhabdaerophilum sp. TaxID=2717341 RepID=UPI0038D4D2D8